MAGKASTRTAQLKLDPVDNQRLARLCGALDAHLRQIESAFDVSISRRGGQFTVRGAQAERAVQALEHFYDRASGELTLDEVQLGLTELVQGLPGPKSE
ncbi:MAG TPA: PhoH family protein, partial [Burkholderiales bacterium]|nr:PhoH family protein [Burkholderiales bacterium]